MGVGGCEGRGGGSVMDVDCSYHAMLMRPARVKAR